ncbi:MAG: hypothetical protein KTV77_04740 [Wolbachia endosymbiont of Fragariocoptes setiger]|nr:hypothetical protein [Wolbachia endosymbiont of Fragariocoptes setiger]
MNLSDSEKVTGPFLISKQVKTLSNTQKVASRLGTTTHIGNYVILSKDLLSMLQMVYKP